MLMTAKDVMDTLNNEQLMKIKQIFICLFLYASEENVFINGESMDDIMNYIDSRINENDNKSYAPIEESFLDTLTTEQRNSVEYLLECTFIDKDDYDGIFEVLKNNEKSILINNDDINSTIIYKYKGEHNKQ